VEEEVERVSGGGEDQGPGGDISVGDEEERGCVVGERAGLQNGQVRGNEQREENSQDVVANRNTDRERGRRTKGLSYLQPMMDNQ